MVVITNQYSKSMSVNYIKISSGAQYFFMFMMFMWVAGVSNFTSFNFSKNPVLMPVYLAILAFYFFRYCKFSIKPLLTFVSIFIIWSIASIIKYGSNLGIHYPPFYSIIIAHIAFNIYNKSEFLKIFEKLLVFFCSLSLVVWLLANVIGDPFVNFMTSISVLPKPQPPTETYSFIVGLGSSFELGLRRNIGFTWEPGVFSCWVLLGIYVNLIRHKFSLFNIRKNKNLYILLVTLLTTLSTTGYSALAIIILFILLNKRSVSSKLIVVALLIAVVPTILGFSFMSEKIIGLMDMDQGIMATNYEGTELGMDVVTPQRFTGLYFSWLSFIHDPLLGFNQYANSYVTKVLFGNTVVVAPSEGLLYNLATYGVFMGLFLYYWLIKSSIYLSKAYHYKGAMMFLAFFLTISFSYSFWENCIFMYFYLCTFYKKFDKRYFDGLIPMPAIKN